MHIIIMKGLIQYFAIKLDCFIRVYSLVVTVLLKYIDIWLFIFLAKHFLLRVFAIKYNNDDCFISNVFSQTLPIMLDAVLPI